MRRSFCGAAVPDGLFGGLYSAESESNGVEISATEEIRNVDGKVRMSVCLLYQVRQGSKNPAQWT